MLVSTFVFLSVSAIIVNGECPEGCNQPIAIYQDLQCKPIYAKPTDCCPTKFDCSNIEKRPTDKCTYKGKAYAIGEQIPQEETYGNCRIGCSCREPEKITCAVLDCPEWLGMRPKLDHYFTYTLDKCCSTGQKTAPYETCKVGGEEYKEGQRFDAPAPLRCTECVCSKGFAGKFVEPFCMKKTCTEELNEIPKIKANCAPSYFGDNGCCPFKWICPDDEKANDEIKTSGKTKDNKEQCKYGSKLLNIGDKFERIEPISDYDRFEINCECLIPPFVTCKQRQVFDFDKTPKHIIDALNIKP